MSGEELRANVTFTAACCVQRNERTLWRRGLPLADLVAMHHGGTGGPRGSRGGSSGSVRLADHAWHIRARRIFAFHALALPPLLLAFSCGGRVTSGGSQGGARALPEDAGSESSASETPDVGSPSPPAEDAGAASSCSAPPFVPFGGSLSGTTCGGTFPPDSPCNQGGPISFFTAEAPDGAFIQIGSSSNIVVFAFGGCPANQWLECGGVPFGVNMTSYRLFAVEMVGLDGGTCGDFTITVTKW